MFKIINLRYPVVMKNNCMKKGIISRVYGSATLAVLTAVVFSAVPVAVAPINAAGTINLEASVNPSVGTAPLYGVDITASVSGTATGDTSFFFDCTSDGSWEYVTTSSNTSYTASDICNYTNPNMYSVRVRVIRDSSSVETVKTILVQAVGTSTPTPIVLPTSGTLTLDGYASPSTGSAPLYGVDVTAVVSGAISSAVTYSFDCTSDGALEYTNSVFATSYTAPDICNYPSAGTYNITIRATHAGSSIQTVKTVLVTGATITPSPVVTPTLGVTLSAQPTSGEEPLYNVDLRATVSGTATGAISYSFDCTYDGTWDHFTTTSNETYTANNLCDYETDGTYTARIRAERQGLIAYDTDQIVVNNNEEPATRSLSVTLDANPNEGYIPLRNVDLSARVSGTARGTITYRFDCTNDGTWDHTHSTSSTSYTAEDVCDYTGVNLYTARVRADRDGRSAYATDRVNAITTTTPSVNQPVISGKGPLPTTGVDGSFIMLWLSAVSSLGGGAFVAGRKMILG